MESFEFLGGRYNRPEQIMSGPVQAFRAQNAATGRTVFIHRVSTTEAPEEQASLLKLMTTALVKSSETKRLVLDFGEERGHWYVVTESEPQCALLREWLQLEIDAAAGHPGSGPAPQAPPMTRAPSVSRQDQTDPGEFTRFLKARPPLNPPASVPRFIPQPPPSIPAVPPPPPAAPPVPPPDAGEFTRIFGAKETSSPKEISKDIAGQPVIPPQPPPVPAPPAQAAAKRPEPGEFTSFFNPGGVQRKPTAPPPPPTMPPPVKTPAQDSAAPAEPGEFTRFFKPGLPPSPQRPSPPPPPTQTTNVERTQNSPFVQRAKNPLTLPPKPVEKGEFTQLFSSPDNSPAPPSGNVQSSPPVRSDPLGFAKQPTNQPNDLSDDLFNDKIDIPKPMPSSQPQQSEFTRMFGAVGSAPPPVPPQSVVAQPREKPMLDENPSKVTQPFAQPNLQNPAPPSNEHAGNSPSEFTRIMQGGYGPAKPVPGTGAPPAGGAAPPARGSSSLPINVNVSPVNPLSALPHLGGGVGGSLGGAHAQASASGASAGTPLGSANVAAPHIPLGQMHVPPANLKIPVAPPAAGANKKLLILFVVIGVLAVLLIVLMLFVMKNK